VKGHVVEGNALVVGEMIVGDIDKGTRGGRTCCGWENEEGTQAGGGHGQVCSVIIWYKLYFSQCHHGAGECKWWRIHSDKKQI
jgi:hypothetical protein